MENSNKSRQFLPPLSEIIDRMTVTQIKLNLIEGGKADFEAELRRLSNDIDVILSEKDIPASSELIYSIVMLSQLNLHIWQNKDEMQLNLENEPKYLSLLKRAHQLNGYRNQIKNRILLLEGIQDASQVRSNFETDGLNFKLGL
jgi:hypothetical protein